MPIYRYKCDNCNRFEDIYKSIANSSRVERCSACKNTMDRDFSGISVIGTRDSFGVGKAFYDPKTNKEIDTWKSWEKAGFKNPLESDFKKNPDVKDKIKFNMKRKKQTKSKAVELAERI